MTEIAHILITGKYMYVYVIASFSIGSERQIRYMFNDAYTCTKLICVIYHIYDNIVLKVVYYVLL